MAKRKLSEKQKDKMCNSSFGRINSSDLTINKRFKDKVRYNEDGTLEYDKRTKEGKEIDKILNSRKRSAKKQDKTFENTDSSVFGVYDRIEEKDIVDDYSDEEDEFEEETWEDEEDSNDDEIAADETESILDGNVGELYEKWNRDPDSNKTRDLCKDVLKYYVEAEDGRDYDSEFDEHPIKAFLRELENIDANFEYFVETVYDEEKESQKEAEDESHWTPKDYDDFCGPDWRDNL